MFPILSLVLLRLFYISFIFKRFYDINIFTNVENVLLALPTFNDPLSKEVGENFEALGEGVPCFQVRDAPSMELESTFTKQNGHIELYRWKNLHFLDNLVFSRRLSANGLSTTSSQP